MFLPICITSNSIAPASPLPLVHLPLACCNNRAHDFLLTFPGNESFRQLFVSIAIERMFFERLFVQYFPVWQRYSLRDLTRRNNSDIVCLETQRERFYLDVHFSIFLLFRFRTIARSKVQIPPNVEPTCYKNCLITNVLTNSRDTLEF